MLPVYAQVFSTSFIGPVPTLPWSNKTVRNSFVPSRGNRLLTKSYLCIDDYATLSKTYTFNGLLDRLKGITFDKKDPVAPLENFKSIMGNYLSVAFEANGSVIRTDIVDRFWLFKTSAVSDAEYTEKLKETIAFVRELQTLPDEELALFCTFGKVESISYTLDELKGLVSYKYTGMMCKTIMCGEEDRYTVKVDIYTSDDPEVENRMSFTLVNIHESLEMFDCYVEVFVHAILLFTGLVPLCSRETFEALLWSVFRNEPYMEKEEKEGKDEKDEKDEKEDKQEAIRDACLRYIAKHPVKPRLISNFKPSIFFRSI